MVEKIYFSGSLFQFGNCTNYNGCLRGLDTLGTFRFIFTRELPACFPADQITSERGLLLREFVPKGSKFFPLVLTAFQKGSKTNLTELPPRIYIH